MRKRLATFRLPESTLEQLKTLAESLKQSQARIIVMAVNQFFNREEKP